MNVYYCHYQGIIGYGCRTGGRSWMFVPELGQPDNRIHKNITLEDLQFSNLYEKQFELEFERRLGIRNLSSLLKLLIFLDYRPQTVSGLLFHRF